MKKTIKKKTVSKKTDEEQVVPTPVVIEESEAKKSLRATIELFKARNPEKYIARKEELQRQLDSIN